MLSAHRAAAHREEAAAGAACRCGRVFVGVLLAAVALIPYFAAGFPTVTGDGSDAFHAVGTAEFLQHNHPTAVNPDGPLDEMPPLWRSKQPIYYVLGAAATLSGLEPYEVLAPVAAVVFALASLGMFVLARALLGGTVVAGLLAAAITGLNAMVLETVTHPYFNQTWGYFAFIFSLVLAWWAVRDRHRGAIALLVRLHAAGRVRVPARAADPGARAHRLLPARPARAQAQRGHPGLPDAAALWRGGRGLAWMIPVAVLLALGGRERRQGRGSYAPAPRPEQLAQGWAGDILHFIPAHEFFGLPTDTLWWLAVAAMAVLTVWLLSELPRPLGWGIAAVLLAFLAAAAWFRQREYGQYFEFKTLAFAAPLLVTCAVVALSRLRRAGALLLVALLVAGHLSARDPVLYTGSQINPALLELREWARDLPADASVRLDTWPPRQLWGSYMLARQPLCSQRPLLETAYPRVRDLAQGRLHPARRGRPQVLRRRAPGRCRPAAAHQQRLRALPDEGERARPGELLEAPRLRHALRSAQRRNRVDDLAQLRLGPLRRELLETRAAPLDQRRAQLGVARASASSSATTAEVASSSSSSAASPATSGTPPAGRAMTGTPKWNASSSGMQKPSCSDSESATVPRGRCGSADRDRAGPGARRSCAGPSGQLGEPLEIAAAERLARAAAAGRPERTPAGTARTRGSRGRAACGVPAGRRTGPAGALGSWRGSGGPNRSGSNRIGTTRTSSRPASRRSRALYAETAAATSTPARSAAAGRGRARRARPRRLEVPQAPRGRDVVVDEQLAVRQVERRLEPRRVRRVVDQQHVVRAPDRAGGARAPARAGAARSPMRRCRRRSPSSRTARGSERLPGDGVEAAPRPTAAGGCAPARTARARARRSALELAQPSQHADVEARLLRLELVRVLAQERAAAPASAT